eukprot:595938-Hanusia_phi.AAC.1
MPGHDDAMGPGPSRDWRHPIKFLLPSFPFKFSSHCLQVRARGPVTVIASTPTVRSDGLLHAKMPWP